MKRTMNGKTFNTDTSIELVVEVGMVDVSNGIKTFVLERMYETRKRNEWFLMTSVIKFRTENECDYLSSDDVFISCERTFQTLENERFRSWMNNLSTT